MRLFLLCFAVYLIGVLQGSIDTGPWGVMVGWAPFFILFLFERPIIRWLSAVSGENCK